MPIERTFGRTFCLLHVPRYVPRANSKSCLLCSAQNAVFILFIEKTTPTKVIEPAEPGAPSRCAIQVAAELLHEAPYEVFVEGGGFTAGGARRDSVRSELKDADQHPSRNPGAVSDLRRKAAGGWEGSPSTRLRGCHRSFTRSCRCFRRSRKCPSPCLRPGSPSRLRRPRNRCHAYRRGRRCQVPHPGRHCHLQLGFGRRRRE